jgi:putative peptidoglycan lipid II flippase
MATSVASWVNVILMAVILHRRGLFRPQSALRRNLAKQTINVAVMGGVLWLAQPYLMPMISGTMTQQITGLSLLVGSGVVSFTAGVFALKLIRPADLKRLSRKK